MGAFILYVTATNCFFTKNVIILQYNLEIDMHALDAHCV